MTDISKEDILNLINDFHEYSNEIEKLQDQISHFRYMLNSVENTEIEFHRLRNALMEASSRLDYVNYERDSTYEHLNNLRPQALLLSINLDEALETD